MLALALLLLALAGSIVALRITGPLRGFSPRWRLGHRLAGASLAAMIGVFMLVVGVASEESPPDVKRNVTIVGAVLFVVGSALVRRELDAWRRTPPRPPVIRPLLRAIRARLSGKAESE
jgi:hypothetical protein